MNGGCAKLSSYVLPAQSVVLILPPYPLVMLHIVFLAACLCARLPPAPVRGMQVDTAAGAGQAGKAKAHTTININAYVHLAY